MAIKSKRIGEQVDRNTLGKIRVLNSSGVDIAKGDIIAVAGSSPGGGHLTVVLAGGVGASTTIQYVGFKLVADHDITDGASGIAVEWAIVDLDTSLLAIGDKLYLSGNVDNNPGKTQTGVPTASEYSRIVGQVLTADAAGKVLLAPSRTWKNLQND